MKKPFPLFLILILAATTIVLFSFQNKTGKKGLTNEEAIQRQLDKKINQFHSTKQRECREKAMSIAIPTVDSLIAENYAKDLRARDFILERPEKPEMPKVEIDTFPLDSIE